MCMALLIQGMQLYFLVRNKANRAQPVVPGALLSGSPVLMAQVNEQQATGCTRGAKSESVCPICLGE